MRTFATILFLCTAAAAQTSIVFPSDHQNIANGDASISWFPFSSGVSRMQIVYDAWDLQLPANTPITRIGFRQDGSATAASQLLQLEVRMGRTLGTSTTLGTTYDTNFQGASNTVFGPALYTLPGFTSATTAAPVWINLTTPYVYDGTSNLLVEFRVLSNNNGNQSFSYPLDMAGFVSPVVAGVQGCPHSGGQRPVLTSQPTRVGGNWSVSLGSGPANSLILLCLAPGQAMTAPYSLQPYVAGIAPSCQGQLPLTGLVVMSGFTNSGGGLSWSVPVPNDRSFNDLVISSQVAALDFFVPGGVALSNADQVQFGIAPAMTVLYSQGNANAAVGSLYPNTGAVTLFN